MPRGDSIAIACDVHSAYAVGGAQRFYTTLARELAAGEERVVYLTRRYWSGPATREEDGVEVIGLTRQIDPQSGGRGVAPKLAFAVGLAWHLLRHGGRYRVVHCCCFPHVALIACRIGLLAHPRTLLVGDWHEVLPRETWRRRLGRIGDLGWLAQRLAIAMPAAAMTFSKLHERRLRDEGRTRPIHVVPEFPTEQRFAASAPIVDPAQREPVIVFAGRLVREKRAHLVPAVLAELRRTDPSWRAEIFGDGPERAHVEAQARRLGVADAVHFAGFAPWEALSGAMARSRALVLPTEREGFGLVVLEAAEHGLPAVLVAEPDNAAVELIEPGRNGAVVASADPVVQAEAVRSLVADAEIHASTLGWYGEHRQRFSVEACADALRALWAEEAPPRASR